MNRRDFLGGIGGCGCAPYLAQNGRPEGADALQAVGYRRMRSEIAGGAVESVRDGFAALPTGPGLGIQVNESALAKYEEKA